MGRDLWSLKTSKSKEPGATLASGIGRAMLSAFTIFKNRKWPRVKTPALLSYIGRGKNPKETDPTHSTKIF